MGDSEDTQKLEEQLAELKEWVAAQPHIPKDMGELDLGETEESCNRDDKLLRRFLHSCYFNIEKAQKAMEVFSSLRATSPELFTDRDPLSPRMQKALQIVKFAQLRISGNRNLWILQLNDPGLRNFDHTEFARNFLIALDAWFLEEDNLQEEDITIMDAKDMSLKIFWKLKMSIAKKLSQYQEEAIPIRVKQMHMVNAPYFIDKLFSIMKQFMTKEMTDIIHFHVPNSDTLHQFLSKDDLPKDYGGNLDSLDVYNEHVIELIHKHREYLMKDDLWSAPEEKSKNNSRNST